MKLAFLSHPSNLFWQVESSRGGETIVRTGQMQDPVGRISVERLCCIDVSVSVLYFCFVVMLYCKILSIYTFLQYVL